MISSIGVPKGCVPVLVGLASGLLSLSCVMHTLYNKSSQQLTFTLRVSVALDGVETEQVFLLQYDADNFTATTVHDTTASVPEGWLNNIAQNTKPWVRTLLLTLKQPCQLWCPQLDRLAPKDEPSSAASFNELRDLTQATEVHIVFDYNRLHTDVRKSIVELMKGKSKLTGRPCEHLLKNWRRADTTVFDSVKAAPLPPLEADPPPPYADSSKKRRSPVSSPASPSPTSSWWTHRKRVRQELRSQGFTQSDTEVDTETDTQAIVYEATPATQLDDVFDPTLQAAMQKKVLKGLIKEALPEVLESGLHALVEKLLPSALHQSFPSLIFALAADSAPVSRDPFLGLVADESRGLSDAFDGPTADESLDSDDNLASKTPEQTKEKIKRQITDKQRFRLKRVEAAILPWLLARIENHDKFEFIDKYITEAYEQQKRQHQHAEITLAETVGDYETALKMLGDEKEGQLETHAGYMLDKVRAIGDQLNAALSRAKRQIDKMEQTKNKHVRGVQRDVKRVARVSLRGMTNDMDALRLKRLKHVKKQMHTLAEGRLNVYAAQLDHMVTQKLDAQLDTLLAAALGRRAEQWRHRQYVSRKLRTGSRRRGLLGSKIHGGKAHFEDSTTEDE